MEQAQGRLIVILFSESELTLSFLERGIVSLSHWRVIVVALDVGNIWVEVTSYRLCYLVQLGYFLQFIDEGEVLVEQRNVEVLAD